MNVRAFLDTNIIIYFYSETEIQKRDIAYKLLDNNDCITSTQMFNEASNVWLKKYMLSVDTIKKYLNNVESVCDEVLLLNRKTIDFALDLKEWYGYSYYDCLMLASALESDCDIILTEDMSDGQIIESKLKIVNPFKNQKREET